MTWAGHTETYGAAKAASLHMKGQANAAKARQATGAFDGIMLIGGMAMNDAKLAVSIAFGAVCKLVADLVETAIDESVEACRERAAELGTLTEKQLNTFRDVERACSFIRGSLRDPMNDAYRKIYAAEIEEAAKWD